MRALGLTGEVIVPSLHVRRHRARPAPPGGHTVFADIDPRTRLHRPRSRCAELITSTTSGILAVHLWEGRPIVTCSKSIADENGLALACNSDAPRTPSACRWVTGWSAPSTRRGAELPRDEFFNTVEGGAIVTNDEELARTDGSCAISAYRRGHGGRRGHQRKAQRDQRRRLGLANLGRLDDAIVANRRPSRGRLQACAGGHPRRVPASGGRGRPRQLPVRRHARRRRCRRESGCRHWRAFRENNVLARWYFWPGAHRMEPTFPSSPMPAREPARHETGRGARDRPTDRDRRRRGRHRGDRRSRTRGRWVNSADPLAPPRSQVGVQRCHTRSADSRQENDRARS